MSIVVNLMLAGFNTLLGLSNVASGRVGLAGFNFAAAGFCMGLAVASAINWHVWRR